MKTFVALIVAGIVLATGSIVWAQQTCAQWHCSRVGDTTNCVCLYYR